MTKASNTITVHAALDSCFTYAEKIATLQAAFRGKTAEAVRASILPDVASYPKYSVPLVAGSGKAEGTKVLDKEHAQYEACRKALGRLVSAIVGKASSGAKEEIEIPAEVPPPRNSPSCAPSMRRHASWHQPLSRRLSLSERGHDVPVVFSTAV